MKLFVNETIGIEATLPQYPSLKVTLSVNEVAVMLGVSTDCIYTMVREQQIPFVRVRRRIIFHRDVIDSWLSGNISL
ncbi:helix-turn-helix domain-containing protein [Cohnella sp. GCM10027633]|uniref:helix-turn-helix domain-containing protein n=1 Tax=unclassified Cohnella TaxID=2636738 RepID=UPI00362758CE